MTHLILYSTSGCHLCEQAEALLEQLGRELPLAWRVVDIANDEQLVKRYGIRIPVLRREADDSELGWPFDLDQLRLLVTQDPA